MLLALSMKEFSPFVTFNPRVWVHPSALALNMRSLVSVSLACSQIDFGHSTCDAFFVFCLFFSPPCLLFFFVRNQLSWTQIFLFIVFFFCRFQLRYSPPMPKANKKKIRNFIAHMCVCLFFFYCLAIIQSSCDHFAQPCGARRARERERVPVPGGRVLTVIGHLHKRWSDGWQHPTEDRTEECSLGWGWCHWQLIRSINSTVPCRSTRLTSTSISP